MSDPPIDEGRKRFPLGAIDLGDGTAHFRVWAPRPRRIRLHLLSSDRFVRLAATGGGYFEATAEVAPGELYMYQLDASRDRPDPASRFQPQGIHAPSQVVSREFAWSDSPWRGVAWRDLAIYESHVGTASPDGTFLGMIGQLDRLVDLGITALELMPVNQFPGDRGWGYDGVHLYAPQNSYGRPEDLKALVDACHARGLAVILDVVYNHLGPEGNYLGEFGPYFTDRRQTAWGPALDFDGSDSQGVREFFIGNALYWLEEFHIDGFRLDATHAIVDRSPTHLLAELAEAVHDCGRRLGRHTFLFAENNANDPVLVRPRSARGYDLDGQLLDDFQRSLHSLLTGERTAYYADFGSTHDFAKADGAGFVLTGGVSKYRHQPWGTDASDIPADRFVAYAQSHDTVANRPHSQRLGRLVGFEALKLAAAAVILSPSIPFLFMGEEYDDPAPFYFFTSYLDRRLSVAVREGRQREMTSMGWNYTAPDPQATKTFDCSRLNPSLADSGRHAVLRDFYRELLRLRRLLPAVRQPARHQGHMTFSDEQQTLAFSRRSEGGEICTVFNFGDAAAGVALPPPAAGQWTLVLDSSAECWQGPGGLAGDLAGAIQAPPKSCLLLVSGRGAEAFAAK